MEFSAAERVKGEERRISKLSRRVTENPDHGFRLVGTNHHIEGVSMHRNIKKIGYLRKVLWVPIRWSEGISPTGSRRCAPSPQFHQGADVS